MKISAIVLVGLCLFSSVTGAAVHEPISQDTNSSGRRTQSRNNGTGQSAIKAAEVLAIDKQIIDLTQKMLLEIADDKAFMETDLRDYSEGLIDRERLRRHLQFYSEHKPKAKDAIVKLDQAKKQLAEDKETLSQYLPKADVTRQRRAQSQDKRIDELLKPDSVFMQWLNSDDLTIDQVPQSEWVYIIQDGNRVWSFQRSTILKTSYRSIKVWIKATTMEGGTAEKKGMKPQPKDVSLKINKILQLNIFDCANRRYKITSSVIYDHDGKVIGTREKSEVLADWQEIVPESVGDFLFKATCGFVNQ